jgi:triacylglycerol lipase
MAMDLQNALRLGQFATAAYNPLPTNPVSYPVRLGYQQVQVLYGNDLATDINAVKDIVPFGFIARSPAPANDFVVAIRGTESIWEWMQDTRFQRVTCPFAAGAGETEDGFTDVYMSLRTSPAGGQRVVDVLRGLMGPIQGATLSITEHSLGASLASLLALDVAENNNLAPSVTTFASPFVGDPQFARSYNAEVPDTSRIANLVDAVPKLPPSFWGFDHVDQAFQVNSLLKAKFNPVCCHILSTYMFLLGQLAGGGNFQLDPTCR